MIKKKEVKKEPITGQEIVPQAPSQLPSRLEGEPEKVIEFASKSAKALTKVMSQKPKKVVIGNEQYLEFEDWQTIGRFYGATVGIEWTKPIKEDEKLIGYEARAIVYLHGKIISSAEAECMRDEANWRDKPQFQLKSMAQTRACAKALRNVFAWVAVLAGYKPTPAEEMNGIKPIPSTKQTIEVGVDGSVVEPFPNRAKGRPRPTTANPVIYKCSDCGEEITKAEVDYSEKNFGMKLCRRCQGKYKKKV